MRNLHPRVLKKHQPTYDLLCKSFYAHKIHEFAFLKEGWFVRVNENDKPVILSTDQVGFFVASLNTKAVAA